MIHAYQLVVLIPYAAALILVAVPGYRVGAAANVVASVATFAAGLWLVVGEGVVSGEVTPDRYRVDKVTLELIDRVIADKVMEYRRVPGRPGMHRPRRASG